MKQLLTILFTLLVYAGATQSKEGTILISADKQEILMGQNVIIDAKFTPPNGEKASSYILLPFVEKRRWGAHEFSNEVGEVSFILPLPNVGYADIEVIAIKRTNDTWRGLDDISLLRTGATMPSVDLISNKIEVRINWRSFPVNKKDKSIFAMQWEPWFVPGWSWKTAHAVPLMGLYDCTNPDVLRQHILWFMDMGIDNIIVDWSNHIWGAKHWTDRGKSTNQILHVTQLFLEMLADMRDENLPVPTVTLMPGLSNGPPASMLALNEELEWIYQNYINNPRFDGLWQIWDGKPLIIILDTGVMATKQGTTESAFRVPFFKQTLTLNGATEASLNKMRQNQTNVNDTHFTIRWMSSQNQITNHDKLGYWSWMDGSLKPITTYKSGNAEAITVCTALFPEKGWKSDGAFGKRNGWTYLKSFQEAQNTQPSFIMLHQYMEFAGQAEGHGYDTDKNIYVDSYSTDLSDDIEPVSLTAPGYRGDKGGWGYFYHNLTKAMISIYKKEVTDATVLAVSIPQISNNKVLFEWTTIGIKPKSYTVFLDDKRIIKDLKAENYSINSTEIEKGKHTIKVVANGVLTRFELSKYKIDNILPELIPVIVEESFFIE